MIKLHDLKTIVCDNIAIRYFYIREKNDVNGNPRFRVYIIDPDAATVYETIVKTYESLIPERVEMFVKEAAHNV